MKKNLFKGKSLFNVPISLAVLFCVLFTSLITAQEFEPDKVAIAK